jgi:hypothetical protein
VYEYCVLDVGKIHYRRPLRRNRSYRTTDAEHFEPKDVEP